MTGNLTNTVLSLMDMLSNKRPLMTVDAGRLKRSLYLLFGFLVGCIVAAAAISLLADWAWSLPVALAAVADGFTSHSRGIKISRILSIAPACYLAAASSRR